MTSTSNTTAAAANTDVNAVVTPEPCLIFPTESGIPSTGPVAKPAHKEKPVAKVNRPSNLVVGDTYAGAKAVVEPWFNYNNKILITVKDKNKAENDPSSDERGVLHTKNLRLPNSGAFKSKEERDAALSALIEDMRAGRAPLPAELVVTHKDHKGATFADAAWLDYETKRQNAQSERTAREADIEAVRAIAPVVASEGVEAKAGAILTNVLVTGHFRTMGKDKDGVEREVISGVFVQLAGRQDGMVHVSQLNGGRKRAGSLVAGKDRLAKVAILEVVDTVKRGKPDVNVRVSETATFGYAVGDTIRGAEFKTQFGHDLVFDANGYEVFVSEENLGTVKRESIAKKGQKTNLKFLGWDRGRITGAKA